ncbi:flagellin [Heliophilum fasciatum]|uniref:Flagellin n=1 Tax=Heliophilum fasciatum TaxID=35700 RepID=A0A4R2RZ76_9FIRM|nr:flagellin [Heliophilum fasciatum]MCW2276676.1 flagellin [Heliophilum fasciatum]TCP68943.1 flagellin [Heliophilum fasciatum]
MRINHNIPAMNTYLYQSNNTAKATKVMEKLSSGMRINGASDDAAGLAVSEKMRSQIRGLRQADRNALDGISMIQTAEGGLAQIQASLQRVRELCVQAANDTYNLSDRQAVQEEIDQIINGITTTVNTTEYNKTKLLRPPIIEASTGNGKADIVFVVDNTGSMAGTQTNVANNLGAFINSVTGKGVTELRMGVLEYTDFTYDIKQFSSSPWTGNATDIQDALLKLAATNSGGIENAMTALELVANQYSFHENTNGAITKHVVLVTNENADDEGKLSGTLALLQSKGIRVHGVYDKNFYEGTADLDTLTQATGGKSVNLSSPSWGTELIDVIGASIGSDATPIESDEMPVITLQIGANQGQTFTLPLFDSRPEKLGLTGLSVATHQSCQEALVKTDEALKTIAYRRALYGAYQNRLEFAGNITGSYQINITSAESRIRDTDMALAMADYTRTNIIDQAATAMLSQANQLPQGILQLLKA